jgi:hypothetical protein
VKSRSNDHADKSAAKQSVDDGFSHEPPHLWLIRKLGGNERDGMCGCPAHNDRKASLSISSGHKRPVVFHCHAGCTFEQVRDQLSQMNLWPVPGADARKGATQAQSKQRTPEERRQYALRIFEDTKRNTGREKAEILKDYFANRGLDCQSAFKIDP